MPSDGAAPLVPAPPSPPSNGTDRRLHPVSILFSFLKQLRAVALPLVLLYVSAGSSGAAWQPWAKLFAPGAAWELWLMFIFLVPGALLAVLRYATFRYRYDPGEMVIRTGVIFRNERHIPYARIQNLDGVQNVLHRLFGVVEVRVETGGGAKTEARMSVLPLADFDEMRRRVLGTRPPVDSAAPEAAPSTSPPPGGRKLLALAPRELLLSGFIHGRGLVLVAAAVGALWQFDLFDRVSESVLGKRSGPSGLGKLAFDQLPLLLAAFLALVVIVRLVAMVWAVVRLRGFELSRVGQDLRTEYGLLTRVTATIPLRRIQTVTVREGPLERLFRRASVRVETAGGGGDSADWNGSGDRDKTSARQRAWLAPIIHRQRLSAFLREVLPNLELDIDGLAWRRVDPRAFRRKLKTSLAFAVAVAAPLAALLRWWDLALLAVLVAWAFVWVRLYVAHLGWAVSGGAVVFKSGWAWRRTTLARFAKTQVVSLHESPFDRRARMARLRVDTAGAGALAHRLDIPYLPAQTARELFARLAAEAAGTAFRW